MFDYHFVLEIICISICSTITFTIIGNLFCAFCRVNTINREEFFFIKLSVAVIFSVCSYAIYITSFKTQLIFLLLIPLFHINGTNFSFNLKLFQKQDFYYLAKFISFFIIFLFVQVLRFEFILDIPFHSVWGDYSHYTLMSKQMAESGLESTNLFSNEIINWRPYHYFDIWFNSLINSFFNFSFNSQLYSFFYIPFFATIIFFGCRSTCRYFNVNKLSFYFLDIITLSFVSGLILNLHFPKSMGAVILILASILSFLKKNNRMAIIYMLMSAVIFPLFVLLYPLILVLLILRRKNNIGIIVSIVIFIIVFVFSNKLNLLELSFRDIYETSITFSVNILSRIFSFKFYLLTFSFLTVFIILILKDEIVKHILNFLAVIVTLYLTHLTVYILLQKNIQKFQIINQLEILILLVFMVFTFNYCYQIFKLSKLKRYVLLIIIFFVTVAEVSGKYIYLNHINSMNEKYGKEFIKNVTNEMKKNSNNGLIAFYKIESLSFMSERKYVVNNLPVYNKTFFILDLINSNSVTIIPAYIPKMLHEITDKDFVKRWHNTIYYKNRKKNLIEFMNDLEINYLLVQKNDSIPYFIENNFIMLAEDNYSNHLFFKRENHLNEKNY